MHRLVIVSGPNRGSSFALIEGENSIGRQMDNHIVLSSGKVSKRHCSLLVSPKEVFLRDEGSTNGTFVNGTLVRKIPLRPGDKVGIGEFVMELTSTTMSTIATHDSMSLTSLPASPHSAMSQPIVSIAPHERHEPIVEEPQDLPGKIKFGFENKVMPFFYGTLMKSEYRSIIAVMLAVLVGISVVGSMMPMTDLAEKSIQREALIRSKVIAREVADRFAPLIASHTESQIDLSFLENEESVKMVVITDPNLQIIAPQSRLNQILGGGSEAAFAMIMAKQFKDGRDTGVGTLMNNSTVAAFIEPIRTTDPRQAKSQFTAMVLVSIDFSSNLIESGGLGVAYGTGFVVAGAVAIFLFFVMMRLTMKPFEVLNDDLDQVLRGELPKVTHEFKIGELDSLWDNINSTIQRLPKGGATSDFGSGESEMVNWDHEFAPIRALCEASHLGFIALDTNLVVVAMNPQFEEVSGIRTDAIGQAILQVARDQSMIALTKDLQERVQSSPSRSALDDFEFSGVAYQVIATGAGPASKPGFAMVFKKKGLTR